MTLPTNYVEGQSGHPASHNQVNGAVNAHIANTTNPHATTLAKISGAVNSVVALATSVVQWLRVDIPDDGSSTATWPDRLAFYYNGIRTGYFNEYGEVRSRAAKASTVAMRAMGYSGGSTGNVFDVTESDLTPLFAVSETETESLVPLYAPNLPQKITVSDTAPASPAEGDVWIDTSGA